MAVVNSNLFHVDPKIAERSGIFFFAKDIVLLLVRFHHAVVVAELHLWRAIGGDYIWGDTLNEP